MERLESLFQQTASRCGVAKNIIQAGWDSFKEVHATNETLYEVRYACTHVNRFIWKGWATIDKMIQLLDVVAAKVCTLGTIC